jgi:hypothetical protein
MLATAALIVGIVRDVIAWPSYRVEVLDELGLPYLAVDPGKHTTRKGWLTRDQHFDRSPFTCDIDAPLWRTSSSEREMSLREVAWHTAWFFRKAIRRVSDPFSYRLLFSVLEGRTPSLLELPDRPPAYDDIGRSIRWGTVLPELDHYAGAMATDLAANAERSWTEEEETEEEEEREFPMVRPRAKPELIRSAQPLRRANDIPERLAAPWTTAQPDRRTSARKGNADRRRALNRYSQAPLERSRYEEVFVRLARGETLHVDGVSFHPVRIRGWYEAELENERGERQVISIDQLADHPELWHEVDRATDPDDADPSYSLHK